MLKELTKQKKESLVHLEPKEILAAAFLIYKYGTGLVKDNLI